MSYNIYLGMIVGDAKVEDSRLQIKILPQMEDIADGYCPLYPYFFKDEMLTGTYGDLVWCVCDDEFSTGYVLGMANYNTYSESTKSFADYSLSETLKETASEALLNLRATQLSFSDIKVTYWNENCVHFVEKSTGGVVYAYSNGSLYIFRPSECVVSVAGNKVTLDTKGISLNGSAINLQSSYVGLGNNPAGNVLVTNGTSGEEATTSKYAHA